MKLDKSKIKGFDQIGSSFKGLSFDPHNDYSIPYFWGTVGIVYNTKLVKKAPQHWDDLWSPDYKIRLCLWMARVKSLVSHSIAWDIA